VIGGVGPLVASRRTGVRTLISGFQGIVLVIFLTLKTPLNPLSHRGIDLSTMSYSLLDFPQSIHTRRSVSESYVLCFKLALKGSMKRHGVIPGDHPILSLSVQ
jgi:hypothetical protein